MPSSYTLAELHLSDGQKKSLIKAISGGIPTKLRLAKVAVPKKGNEIIAITDRQIAQVVKAHEHKTGVTLALSKAQLDWMRKNAVLSKLITGTGFFSDVFRVAKKVGGVVADRVLVPAGHLAAKLAKDVGGKALGKAAKVACDSLAVATLTETQPELLPLAFAACEEAGGAVEGAVKGSGCACEAMPTKKRGRGRPRKSQ